MMPVCWFVTGTIECETSEDRDLHRRACDAERSVLVRLRAPSPPVFFGCPFMHRHPERQSPSSSAASAASELVRELAISPALHEHILRHLLDAVPNEGVGLLAVDRRLDTDGTATARRFFPGTNIDASPTRYTMDPTEVLNAIRVIEREGWRLGAIVHSHPTSPATPSVTDFREAYYPHALLLIVTLATHPAEMRAWRIEREHGGTASRGVQIPIVVPHREVPSVR